MAIVWDDQAPSFDKEDFDTPEPMVDNTGKNAGILKTAKDIEAGKPSPYPARWRPEDPPYTKAEYNPGKGSVSTSPKIVWDDPQQAPKQESPAMQTLFNEIQKAKPNEPIKEENPVMAFGKAVASTLVDMSVGQVDSLNTILDAMVEEVASGRYGKGLTPEQEQKIQARHPSGSRYEPESDTAQQYKQQIGEAMEPLTAIMPDLQTLHGATSLHTPPKVKIPGARDPKDVPSNIPEAKTTPEEPKADVTKPVTPNDPVPVDDMISRIETKIQEEAAKPPEEPAPKAPASKLAETAFKDPETGDIHQTGPKHPEDLKAKRPDFVQGFVDEEGNFLDRKEAAARAKDTGQIPEDHPLERPEEGLHSGDLRANKDPSFAIHTETNRPVHLDDTVPPKYLYHGTRATPEIDEKGNLVLRPAKNFGGKTNSVSLTHNEDYATDYASRLRGEGPGSVDFTNSKTIKIHSDALPEGISRENGEEWAFNTDKPITIPKGKFEVVEHPLSKPVLKENVNYTYEEWIKNQTENEIERDWLRETKDNHFHQYLWNAYPHSSKEHAKLKAHEAAIRKEVARLESVVEARSTGKYKEPPVEWNQPKKSAEASKKQSPITSPTYKEIEPLLNKAHTLREAIKAILDAGHGNIAERTLLKKFYSKTALLGVRFVLGGIDKKNPGKSLGRYDASNAGRAVTLFEGTNAESRSAVQIIAHETVHALVAHLIQAGKHPSVQALNDLFGNFKDIHRKSFVDAGTMTAEEYDKKPPLYGFTNLQEFVAEAFSNPRLQAFLDSIPVDPKVPSKGSMWKQFKNYVKDMLGVSKDSRVATALDQVLDHGAALIEDPGKTSKDISLAAKEDPATSESIRRDPRAVTSNIDLENKATEIYKNEGKEAATAFIKAYNDYQKEHHVPPPAELKDLSDVFHKLGTFKDKDQSESRQRHEAATKEGVTTEQREALTKEWEDGKTDSPLYQKWIKPLVDEANALYAKAQAKGFVPPDELNPNHMGRYRLFAPKERTMQELVENKGHMSPVLEDPASSMLNRTMYVLEDGKDRKVVQLDGNNVIHWQGKNPKAGQVRADGSKESSHVKGPLGKSDKPLRVGDKFGRYTLQEAKIEELEAATPFKYLKDAQAVAELKLQELRKFDRENTLIENLKPMLVKEGVAQDTIVTNPRDFKKGFRHPKYLDKMPQFSGYIFEPKVAEVIEDYSKTYGSGAWNKITSFLIKNMMLNPIPHIFNEGAHLWNARGLTGWVSPGGLMRFGRTWRSAWKSVREQDQFFRDVMKEGGSILSADTRNNPYFDQIFKDASAAAFKSEEFSSAMARVGLKTVDAYNAWSRASNTAMWSVRDTMYVQLIKETMEKRGVSMKEAIARVERHMPNYRMPQRIMGSRGLSETLANPAVSVFSRYHVGMVKSLVHTVEDLANIRNIKDPKARERFLEGANTGLAITAMMGIMYPVMDEIAKSLMDDSEAEMRRAGPYHLLYAARDVLSGKKDLSALLWPVFTFNPVLLSGAQFLANKKVYTGQSIYYPDDPGSKQIDDVTRYAVGQVPVPGMILQAYGEGGGGVQQSLGRQLDIKSKSPAARAREERAQKIRDRNRKTRLRKWEAD